jgi:hypothetical protein
MLGRNNSFGRAEQSELSDRLSILLSVQLAVSGTQSNEVAKIEVTKGLINRKAIGYIYGFIDCALQFRDQDITDISVGLPILYHVMRNLFPGHEQAYIDFLMDQMEDEVVVLGMMAGGQEYNEFIQANGTGFGLAKFIRESRNQQE